MFYDEQTIGMAFTGDVDELDKFFKQYYRQLKNPKLPKLQRQLVCPVLFYCLLLKDFKWEGLHQDELVNLCMAANQAKLSYCITHFNKKNNEKILDSNSDAPFFDYRVRQVFIVRKIAEFEDWRYRTFKDWMKAQFDREELLGIVENGANCGWNGLTYYAETIELYQRYSDDIWNILYESCNEQGHKSIPEFIASFNGADVTDDIQFKNLLVWYAAEREALALIDEDGDMKG